MTMDHTTPKISVIIPNLHSPIIDRTLDSVLRQETEYAFEVIVVGMDQYDLVEQFDQVTFLRTPSPVGAAEARNIGIRHAQGEWLLFIDSDCLAQPGWINTFAHEFEAGRKVIGGGVITPEEPFWLLVYNLSMFHGQLASESRYEPDFLPTLNLAVHHEVIDKVGVMDEDLMRGQDVDWTSRMTLAGYRLLFEPAAAITHLPARKDLKTLRDYVRKSGYYMIHVRHKYPEIFHMPAILKKPLVWEVLAPFIAVYITVKIILKTKEVRKHMRIVPYMYLQKVSWCYGAAESLREMRKNGK